MDSNLEKVRAALGLLADLYMDPDVLEIMVDGPERVLVERQGRLEDAGLKFASPEPIQAIITALLGLSQETAVPGQTILPIHFPGREARGMAVLPPTALEGPCLIIRKLMNTHRITWEQLIEWGSVTQEAHAFLQAAVRAPVNILVAGGTGSGKTTVANRIAELIPAEERLVIVEKDHELQIRHPRAVYLEASGQTGVSIAELINTGAMMRPDWLIIGELCGSEAMPAVEILGRGHSGMTTIHANSLEDALARLEAMCLTANLGLGILEIRSLISAAIQLICYQQRLQDGSRKILEIAGLSGVEDGRYLLERYFRHNPETHRLEATGIKPAWA